jgi:hypothetical protein
VRRVTCCCDSWSSAFVVASLLQSLHVRLSAASVLLSRLRAGAANVHSTMCCPSPPISAVLSEPLRLVVARYGHFNMNTSYFFCYDPVKMQAIFGEPASSDILLGLAAAHTVGSCCRMPCFSWVWRVWPRFASSHLVRSLFFCRPSAQAEQRDLPHKMRRVPE